MKVSARDAETAAEVSLTICEECGWYVHSYGQKCEPASGLVVQKLLDAIPEVASGKLGYGHKSFVFEPDPDFHVQFEIGGRKNHPRPFVLREVWLLDDLDQAAAEDLVRVLAAWRKRHHDGRKRRST